MRTSRVIALLSGAARRAAPRDDGAGRDFTTVRAFAATCFTGFTGVAERPGALAGAAGFRVAMCTSFAAFGGTRASVDLAAVRVVSACFFVVGFVAVRVGGFVAADRVATTVRACFGADAFAGTRSTCFAGFAPRELGGVCLPDANDVLRATAARTGALAGVRRDAERGVGTTRRAKERANCGPNITRKSGRGQRPARAGTEHCTRD